LPPARGPPYAPLRSAYGPARAVGLRLTDWRRDWGQISEATTKPEREQGTEGGEKREHADDGMAAALETLYFPSGFAL
jgi:hypothetical protein